MVHSPWVGSKTGLDRPAEKTVHVGLGRDPSSGLDSWRAGDREAPLSTRAIDSHVPMLWMAMDRRAISRRRTRREPARRGSGDTVGHPAAHLWVSDAAGAGDPLALGR